MTKKYNNYSEAIFGMRPGDSLDVHFPEGFELECKKWQNGSYQTVKFVCERMNAWYWDDDDHCCLDRYFYEPNINNDRWHSHICKLRDLTNESYNKVSEYLRNTEYPYND